MNENKRVLDYATPATNRESSGCAGCLLIIVIYLGISVIWIGALLLVTWLHYRS